MGLFRLLLALSVVMAHSYPAFANGLVGGRTAVQCFFVISGFYIALILNTQYKSTRDFYINRALRLYPSYLAVLGLTFALCLLVVGFPQHPLTWYNAALLVFSNLSLLFQDLFFLTGLDGATGQMYLTADFRSQPVSTAWFLLLPQAWSISIELAFYAIAPFTVRRPRALLAVFAASLLVRGATYSQFGAHDPWTYRFMLSEMGLFALGALAWHLSVRLKGFYARRPVVWVGSGLAFAGLMLFSPLQTTLTAQLGSAAWGPVSDVAGEVSTFLLVALTAATLPCLMNLTKGNTADRYIGDLSYPVYIAHILILKILGGIHISYQNVDSPHQGMLVIISSLAMAAFIHQTIESPISSYRDKIRNRNTPHYEKQNLSPEEAPIHVKTQTASP